VKTSLNKSLRHLRRSIGKGRKPAGLMLALAVSATVVAAPPAHHDASPNQSGKSPHRWYQIGKASWYGRAFQGRRTATGERFNMNALTCAHRTLPLGSWLRVTNLQNRQSTFVRVNDRGPFVGDAVIDLSYAAAQKVGLLGKAEVRVERVSPDDPELAHALVSQLTSPFSATNQP
jgi:rare lipoprotein A